MHIPFVRSIVRAAAPLALLGAAGCDSTAIDRVPLSVSFSGQSPAAALNTGISAAVTVSEGGNTLVITKAQIIVDQIELKRATTTQCAVDDSASDDCEEFSVGPFLVDIPVTGTSVTTIGATIPPDTYREIEFEIRKVGSDTPEERAIAAAHPEFSVNSVRVEGTFNGTPFVFLSELDEELELEFSVPVVIVEADQNVTIQLDLAGWFRNGSTLVNPATANKDGANESLVRQNIRASIRAFADDDRNGH